MLATVRVATARPGASSRLRVSGAGAPLSAPHLRRPARCLPETNESTGSSSDAAAAGASAPQDATAPTTTTASNSSSSRPRQQPAGGKRRQAESTDAVATFLTRRFGIAGGLAWLGVLAVGTLGEQVKTRMEVEEEKKNTRDVQNAREVVLPSGVRYTDLRLGGGQTPSRGFITVIDYVGRADGVVFEDTRARGKPIVYLYGARPFVGGMCPGTEEALATMRAGGKRRIVVPAALGFGERGAVLRPTEHVPEKQGIVPPNADLVYELELVRVSIPPS